MAKRSPLRVHHPVVWVTGASRGIGREIAKQFAMTGFRVCVSARNAKELASLVDEIVSRGGRAYSYPCDITHARAVQSVADHIANRIGKVEVLVNNAGVTVFKSFLSTSYLEFESIIGTNLLGQVAALKSVLPSMVRRRKGWVINILSTAAKKTFEGSAAYTAAKAGMHGLSKVLREEMRRYNVKVVDVMPGPTDTPMWSAGSRKKHASRMMKATSVAEAVLALYTLPSDVVPEEIMLSPIRGDIA